jgi:isopenicillin N synthase-like dioxygenase
MDLAWTTPEANRGYSAPGREKVSLAAQGLSDVGKLREAAPDLKESFEIGREGDPGHPNQWPGAGADASVAEFKPGMLDFFDQCKGVHVEVMRAIAVGMGLDEHFFDSFVDVGDNTLRLLHYPAVDTTVFKENPNAVRAGAHSVSGKP